MSDKIKILYLGTNRVYMNPTIQLIYKAVGVSTDMTCYGPGFQSDKVLSNGVCEFVSENGPFDFVLTDGVVLFFKDLKPFSTSYNYFDINSIENVVNDMRSYFKSCTLKKLFYPAIDYYNVTKEEIKVIEDSNSYLITWGIEFHEYLDQCEDTKYESFMGKDENDNWINFVSRNESKIISIPQIIDNSEFNFLPLSSRKYEISVPGASYYRRREAVKQLNKSQFNFKMNSSHTGIKQKLWNKVIRLQNRFSFNLNQVNFRNTIEDSKIIYTCGGCLKYPIRKFLEVPALGSALFFEPFKGYEEFGFINGINSIIIDDMDQISEITKYNLNHLDELQEIATKGQALIWEKHSLFARGIQINQSLKSISIHEFKGSYWEKGEFKLR